MSVTSDAVFVPLNIAVSAVCVTSGQLLISRLSEAGRRLRERNLLKDDLYKVRAQVATGGCIVAI
ncbi:molybdopterin biosynthesis enzyme MoaB [Pseudomonas sp. W4I3]|nr:molybdopterin biosynthesis enzyme MoaB [Pseudomonas sp. W4I3]